MSALEILQARLAAMDIWDSQYSIVATCIAALAKLEGNPAHDSTNPTKHKH